jgi:hypothetical protein
LLAQRNIKITIPDVSESLSESRPRFTFPLAVWLLVQLLSLALSAFQIRLTYRWVDPAQKWAVEQMLALQIICTSLIILSSFRSISFSASAFLTGGVMLTFAHVLAAGETELVGSILALGVWILTAHVLSITWPTPTLTAVLTLWTFGGILLQYLAIEFGGGGSAVCYSPILAAIAIARDEAHTSAWLLLILALIAPFGASKLVRSLSKIS